VLYTFRIVVVEGYYRTNNKNAFQKHKTRS